MYPCCLFSIREYPISLNFHANNYSIIISIDFLSSRQYGHPPHPIKQYNLHLSDRFFQIFILFYPFVSDKMIIVQQYFLRLYIFKGHQEFSPMGSGSLILRSSVCQHSQKSYFFAVQGEMFQFTQGQNDIGNNIVSLLRGGGRSNISFALCMKIYIINFIIITIIVVVIIIIVNFHTVREQPKFTGKSPGKPLLFGLKKSLPPPPNFLGKQGQDLYQLRFPRYQCCSSAIKPCNFEAGSSHLQYQCCSSVIKQ